MVYQLPAPLFLPKGHQIGSESMVCWEKPSKLVDVPSVFDTDFFRLGMDCQGGVLLGSEGSVR